MNRNELIDLDTFIAMKKAAPQITLIPFDVARMAILAMNTYARSVVCHSDRDGKIYWEVSLKGLHTACDLGTAVTARQLAQVLRMVGIDAWRKTDGYHIAFSQDQLDILMKHFEAVEDVDDHTSD